METYSANPVDGGGTNAVECVERTKSIQAEDAATEKGAKVFAKFSE